MERQQLAMNAGIPNRANLLLRRSEFFSSNNPTNGWPGKEIPLPISALL
jgi:hypothetical protein